MTGQKYSSSAQWLLHQVESYLAENPDVTAEGFGWRAIKDPRLVSRLRTGGDITTGKMDQVIRYLANPTNKGEEK
jgi:hypothetical protein